MVARQRACHRVFEGNMRVFVGMGRRFRSGALAMAIEALTDHEMAAFIRDTETRVVRVHGHWWFEPKPFFFRPLLPLVEIHPSPRHYPARAWFGGIQHCVPESAPANSSKSYFIF